MILIWVEEIPNIPRLPRVTPLYKQFAESHVIWNPFEPTGQ